MTLTERQRQIAELVAEGYTNQQIAGQLGISMRRVQGLLPVIAKKLEVVHRDRDVRVQIAVLWTTRAA